MNIEMKDEKELDVNHIEINNIPEKKDNSSYKYETVDLGKKGQKIGSNIPNINSHNPEIAPNPHDQTDNEIKEFDKFQVPTHLKRTCICSLILFVIGLTLFILGFISGVAAADPGKGITFWVLGSIVMIPGGYYSYQFYKARKTRSADERDDILDQIPEL
jgi:hypothetical protein